jgi:hypothetical protein
LPYDPYPETLEEFVIQVQEGHAIMSIEWIDEDEGLTPEQRRRQEALRDQQAQRRADERRMRRRIDVQDGKIESLLRTVRAQQRKIECLQGMLAGQAQHV